MFLSSRISHWYHKWCLRLEAALVSAGVEWEVPSSSATLSAQFKPRILTHEEEERFLTIPGQDQGVLPPPLPLEQSMKIVTMDDALQACQCVHTPVAQLCAISPETQHYIDAVGEFIPHYLDIVCKHPNMLELEEDPDAPMDGGSSGAAAAAAAGSSAAAAAEPARQVVGEVARVKVDRQAVLDMVRKGSRDDLVELREEFGVNSPVRHFTPPNYRAFCVVAKQFIPQGTFVFCYGGEITEEIVNRESCYVYTIEREQVRRTVRAYHGPELHLDALKKGNIARFVNDNMYRQGEAEHKGISANLETQFIFLKEPDQPGTIHLAFYTTKAVRAGEELVSQYGESYCTLLNPFNLLDDTRQDMAMQQLLSRSCADDVSHVVLCFARCHVSVVFSAGSVINKQLQSDHRKFFEYVEPYTRQLERLCLTNGVSLPSHPPSDWSVSPEDLFTPKVKPYPSLSSSSAASDDEAGEEDAGSDADSEEAFEVERILNRRLGDDGQTWYKVKWKHHAASHNEWIPQRNVLHCQELIEEFNASQAQPKKGTKGTKHGGGGGHSSAGQKRK
jgi:hypothetical protein